MDIVPFVGETPLHANAFSIRVDPGDKERVAQLATRASQITVVQNAENFALAKHTAGQLKALLDEIDAARKVSKRPQLVLNNAIEELATNIAAPLANEHRRILGLLNAYVAQIEAIEKAEARRREEAIRAQLAEQQRKLKEAQAAQARAEEAARKATELAEQMRLAAEAQRRKEALEDAQLAQEMALEAARITEQQTPKAKVPGGRVDHVYEFELIDIQAVVKAGGWRLLRWDLDKRACMDQIRAQLESDKDATPVLPGIRITRKTSVSVRATI
jgi:hypothetical protein